MGISIINAAPDKLLTTVARVKSSQGITGTDSDDDIANRIQEVSDFIENYTGRTFAQEHIKETVRGDNLPNLLLSRTPIISIDQVTLDNSVVTDYSILDPKAGILQRRLGWSSTNLPWATIAPHLSPYYEERWAFTYIGGYILPGWNTTGIPRTLPYDLERAAVRMVYLGIMNAKVDGSWSRYTIGDTTVMWDRKKELEGDPSGLPSDVLGILNYYRRPF